MNDTYIIQGGKPLNGHVQISGAKNVALKVLIAALLFDSPVTLHNMPRIQDIHELTSLLTQLGVQISFNQNTVTVDSSNLKEAHIDLDHAAKIRVSFMLFAPMLYRFKKAIIPNPGGCRLGARSIDRVIDGLKALDIEVAYDSSTGYYDAVMTQKPHGSYVFPKPTHTGTEMMIMMSVFGQGTIVIENAAQEPEIDDLINFLNEGGAQISRDESTITIEGVSSLSQSKPYTIAPDKIEAATYAVLGIASKGDVTISAVPKHFIHTFNQTLKSIGAGVEDLGDGKWRYYYQPMHGAHIETAPYPGFVTDWQPLLAVLLTQAEGESTIHERIFENRFSYVKELRKLGAQITFIKKDISDPGQHYHFNFDPKKEYKQTIQINGIRTLHGGVLNVSDLRAGATLAIAALISTGTSYVNGIHHLQRGYENFIEKVKALGGDIQVM
ncbi:MAG: UDP-N-acetylglucosamine 1-carboxyvinyltransferase [bacterium]|nr:UDP-N-acetylglucosamine 1-carboxyvinyltransferase [bacterium]